MRYRTLRPCPANVRRSSGRVLDKQGLAPREMRSLIGLADALLLQSQPDIALTIYNRALNIFARLANVKPADKHVLAHALEAMGQIAMRQKSSDQALKYMLRSVRITKELPNSEACEISAPPKGDSANLLSARRSTNVFRISSVLKTHIEHIRSATIAHPAGDQWCEYDTINKFRIISLTFFNVGLQSR